MGFTAIIKRLRGAGRRLDGRGVTFIELVVVLALLAIVAMIAVPQFGRFASQSRVKRAATELFQNIRLARTMAIKENRQYLIVFDTVNNRYFVGFDATGDNDLLDAADTYALCNDTDGDRLPNSNPDRNGDGVPDCVKTYRLANDYGQTVRFGTLAEHRMDGAALGAADCNARTACFQGTNPIRITFNADGSVNETGEVYLEESDSGIAYAISLNNSAGDLDLWRWEGDADTQPAAEPYWTEVR
jgi:prepilin-type N-terminal cleavage/methylation domain-containing protein